MRTFCGLAAAFLLAVAPGARAQLDNAPTPVPLPIPIAAASAPCRRKTRRLARRACARNR